MSGFTRRIRRGVDRHWALLIPLGFAILSFHRWLGPGLFTFGDLRFNFPEANRTLTDPTMWISSVGLGEPDVQAWRLPIYLVYGVFARLGFDSGAAERFLVFLPLIVIPVMASYLLVREVVGHPLAAAAGSLVYSFNTYFLAIETQGHVFIVLAAAWSTIAMWLYLRVWSHPHRGRYAPGVVLALFAAGAYDVRFVYITVMIFAFFAAAKLFSGLVRRDLRVHAPRLAWSLGIVALLALVNAYWIIPQLHVGGTGNPLAERGLFGNQFMSIRHAASLHHPFWNGGKPTWFQSQPVQPYFYAIPLLAVTGLVLARKKGNILFFGFLSVGGILLAKQAGNPFPNLYSWLFENFPGFRAFREGTKFFFVIALGHAVLIGAAISWMMDSGRADTRRRALAAGLFLVVVALFGFNLRPIVRGDIGTLHVPRHIPADYQILREHLTTQQDDFRVMWIPQESRWSPYSTRHPRLGGAAWLDATLPLLDAQRDQPFGAQILSAIREPLAESLLGVASVRYVVVPLQDVANDDDFFPDYGVERERYIETLDSVGYLERFDIGARELVVYRNRSARPRTLIHRSVIGFDHSSQVRAGVSRPNGGPMFDFAVPGPGQSREPLKSRSEPSGPPQATVPVTERRIHPTESVITVEGVRDSFFISVSEAYHKEWRLAVGGDARAPQSQYEISDRFHYRLDGLINAWHVEPQRICAAARVCTPRVDGSFDMVFTAYFAPQRSMRRALPVSVATLVLMLAAWVFLRTRRVVFPIGES